MGSMKQRQRDMVITLKAELAEGHRADGTPYTPEEIAEREAILAALRDKGVV